MPEEYWNDGPDGYRAMTDYIKPPPKKPRRVYQQSRSWTDIERDRLSRMFLGRCQLWHMCLVLQRTPGSIIYQLVKLKLCNHMTPVWSGGLVTKKGNMAWLMPYQEFRVIKQYEERINANNK